MLLYFLKTEHNIEYYLELQELYCGALRDTIEAVSEKRRNQLLKQLRIMLQEERETSNVSGAL